MSGNLEDAVSIFQYLDLNKYRVIDFTGDERTYRTLVCAVTASNTKKGIGWISV